MHRALRELEKPKKKPIFFVDAFINTHEPQ